jgi:hypothetical protein
MLTHRTKANGSILKRCDLCVKINIKQLMQHDVKVWLRIVSAVQVENVPNRFGSSKCMEMPGIEPGAFHMQSERSTAELQPHLKLVNECYRLQCRPICYAIHSVIFLFRSLSSRCSSTPSNTV